MRKLAIFFVLSGAVVAFLCAGVDKGSADSADFPSKTGDDLPYPQGPRFPLGLYSMDVKESEEVVMIGKCGWNLGHTYGPQEELMNHLQQSDMFAYLRVGHEQPDHPLNTQTSAKATIVRFAAYDRLAWWDFPEERRYWIPEENNLIRNWSQWTRDHDPKKRPNFMYIPGHYPAEAVAKYVPYLDIIGAGTYTEYFHQTRAWVRYRIESVIEGIRIGGGKIGPNYLKGEKTPIGIPMLFSDVSKFDVITPQNAYHDFYSCLASGARGILIFSHFHRNDKPGLQNVYNAYAKAASEVSGPEGLGEALLFGNPVVVGFEILQGPRQTKSFRPRGSTSITFPSLNVRAIQWNGSLYILVVNSAEDSSPVKAALLNLPTRSKELQVLFEARTLPVCCDKVEDEFLSPGVHIYKARL